MHHIPVPYHLVVLHVKKFAPDAPLQPPPTGTSPSALTATHSTREGPISVTTTPVVTASKANDAKPSSSPPDPSSSPPDPSSASSYTIREVRADEVPVAAALWHRNYFDQQGSEHIPTALADERRTLDKCVLSFQKKLSSANYCALFAVASDGQPRGLAVLKSAGDDAEVEQFFLDRSARGTGLAKELMAAAESKLRDMVPVSCERYFLYVLVDNKRARRFYERYGFSNMGDDVEDVHLSGGRTVHLELLRYEKVLPSN